MARASLAACAVLAAFATVACGTDATNRTGTTSRSVAGSAGADKATAGADKATGKRVADPRPSYPRLLRSATSPRPTGFVPAVTWRRQTAVWIARSGSRIALLSFNQRLIELRLHAGTEDPGSSGWRLGPEVAGAERQRLVAAFNGGFKLDIGAGGFFSHGRDRRAAATRARLDRDLHRRVHRYRRLAAGCARGREASRFGPPEPDAADLRRPPCLDARLPHLLGGDARGCQRPGPLCTRDHRGRPPDLGRRRASHDDELANALLAAHVVRAVELDINPEWVAGYLYGHRGGQGRSRRCRSSPASRGSRASSSPRRTRDFFALVPLSSTVTSAP